MRGVRLRTAVVASVALLVLSSTGAAWAAEARQQTQPAVVYESTKYTSGDWRCMYGPGMQVWQDAYKGGPSMILCGFHARYNNISGRQDGLDYGANWNDRISSYEVFNSNRLSLKWYVCTDANFGGTCLYGIGDGYTAYVGNTYNDQITSIGD